jgi:LCP family protein required for cell wall assembly
MSRPPDGWAYSPYERGSRPEDRTVVLPPGQQPPAQPGYPGYQGRPGYQQGYPGYGWQDEPPRRRRRWGRRIAMLLVLLLVAIVGLAVVADRRLNRVEALADYRGRPAATPGTDWLIVGSDTRKGLSAAEKRKLATGDTGNDPGRTDTIMLLHVPRGGGQAVLVSLPRDSYVPIPGRGRNKLNAAFAFGGPQLLARTVETVTGIRLDHYLEIGFGGFAQLVDAVGGVRICVDKAIKDPNAGINLKAGCQVLNSRNALGYVRTRATAKGDLDRVERQQEFMGALIDKVASPGTLLNPMRSVPLLLDGSEALTVDDGDHIWHLGRLGLALRDISGGKGVKTTVPIGGSDNVKTAGAVLLWDREKALALFNALKADRPVPSGVLEQKK